MLEIVQNGGQSQVALPIRWLDSSICHNLLDNSWFREKDEVTLKSQDKDAGYKDIQHIHLGEGELLKREREQE